MLADLAYCKKAEPDAEMQKFVHSIAAKIRQKPNIGRRDVTPTNFCPWDDR